MLGLGDFANHIHFQSLLVENRGSEAQIQLAGHFNGIARYKRISFRGYTTPFLIKVIN